MKNLRSMWDNNLRSMVQGLRANQDEEEEYLSKCIQEIRKEISSGNVPTKANAITKLWYLQMLGYDMTWAAFSIVEVMSFPKYSSKLPSYHACASSFTDHTEVALLVNNLFKKDFAGKEMFQTTLALSCLACMGTPELCRDLYPDTASLLTSSRAYIRKKAVLCLFRIFAKYPQSIESCLPRLRERLEDEDQGVLTATVNVLMEVAKKEPARYLPFVPQLYHLLINTQNNWLAIKIMRFFGFLSPAEPKLPPKLLEPLMNLLKNTRAKSVEYEAMKVLLEHMTLSRVAVDVALTHLAGFVDSCDKNLRYLGLNLLALSVQQKEVYPRVVKTFPELHQRVLEFVEDSDSSVRDVALSMLEKIASPSTFQEIADKLLVFGRDFPASSDEVSFALLHLASKNNYSLVTNFEWYLVMLAQISRFQGGGKYAEDVADEMIRITASDPSVRESAVVLSCFLVATTEENTTIEATGTNEPAVAYSEHLQPEESTSDAHSTQSLGLASDTQDLGSSSKGGQALLNNESIAEAVDGEVVPEGESYMIEKSQASRPTGIDTTGNTGNVQMMYTTAPKDCEQQSALSTFSYGAGRGSAVNATRVGPLGRRTRNSRLVCPPVVGAAAWIIGEYHSSCQQLLNNKTFSSPFSPLPCNITSVLQRILSQAGDSMNTASVQQTCIWAALKLYIGLARHAFDHSPTPPGLGSVYSPTTTVNSNTYGNIFSPVTSTATHPIHPLDRQPFAQSVSVYNVNLISSMRRLLLTALPEFKSSTQVEVNDRATFAAEYVEYFLLSPPATVTSKASSLSESLRRMQLLSEGSILFHPLLTSTSLAVSVPVTKAAAQLSRMAVSSVDLSTPFGPPPCAPPTP